VSHCTLNSLNLSYNVFSSDCTTLEVRIKGQHCSEPLLTVGQNQINYSQKSLREVIVWLLIRTTSFSKHDCFHLMKANHLNASSLLTVKSSGSIRYFEISIWWTKWLTTLWDHVQLNRTTPSLLRSSTITLRLKTFQRLFFLHKSDRQGIGKQPRKQTYANSKGLQGFSTGWCSGR